MKKLVMLALVVPLISQLSFAQPSQAEMDKKIKEAQQQMEKMQNDPKLQEYYKKIPNLDSVKKKMGNMDSVRNSGAPAAGNAQKNNKDVFSIPSKNQKYIDALPIRVFNKVELVSYLHNLNSKLTEVLKNSFDTNIKTIPIHSALEGSETSVALWLNGKQNDAVLLAMKAAEMDADNVIALNTAAGILTNCGLGINAIPILQYILEKNPGNSTVLNNLGQAYLSLGDTKTAEIYLTKCVSDSKYHPDANLALAIINKAMGNKAEAIRYAENSLRGAYSIPAYNLLLLLKPDAKLMDYIRHRYKQPEYFNFDKFPLLPQCRDTKNTPILKPQYAAYKEMLAKVIRKYEQLQKQEEAISQKEVTDKMMTDLKINKSPHRPFGVFAAVVLADIYSNEYGDKLLKFAEFKKEWQAHREKLVAECLAEQKAITAKHKDHKAEVAERDGEGNANANEYDELNASICAEKEVVRNRYLNLLADAAEAYQQKAIHLYKPYLNDLGFWYYVSSITDHQYKAQFYSLAVQFLRVLVDINTTHFYAPCQGMDSNEESSKEITIEVPDCYFPQTLKIPLGIASIELDCKEYKLDAGEGLLLNIKYDRLARETTLAFGPGVEIPRMPKFSYGGIDVTTGATVSGQAFIKFNNDGTPLDWGLIWTGNIDLKAKAFGMGKSFSNTDVVTIGYNSGVQMEEGGGLKFLIDKMYAVQPDAKQINKNVRLYK